MGILDRLTATPDGSSAAIAKRITEVQGQHAKRTQEIHNLEHDTVPVAESEIGRLLAEQELGEATDDAAVAAAKKALRTAQDQLQAKRLANAQLEAALTEMRRRHDVARLAEIRKEREALAEQFETAAKEAVNLILQAAQANKRAEQARYKEWLLRQDPLVAAANQRGALIDPALDQLIGGRLQQTVTALESQYGNQGLPLPGDPGIPDPVTMPPGGLSIPATVALNFRQQ